MSTASPSGRPLAVVTGASGGIGLEIARLAGRDGYDLLLVARSEDRLAAAASEIERNCAVGARSVVADLARPEGVEALIDALVGIEVDVLVNNAGVGGQGRFAIERDVTEDMAMISLNVDAVVRLTGAVLPGMVRRGRGGILNVASSAGFAPGPLQAVYYASKAFACSFSQALTEECRGTGVRVTALCPGPVDTGFAAAAGTQGIRLMRSRLMKVPADKVAVAGWEGLKRGRAVVIPGLVTQASVQGLRISPRRLAARIIETTHAH